ncbi:hypothetical protein LIER_33049 [Lithospermum erythrorhizon]|uniref:Uncharacterized protein n=1 Tax=Lithospermum erythrorhizon TaxID=34254 RepID=A0AAV3S0V2_LITER
MRGKRSIAFKRVKAVKKVDSSPRPASKTIPTPRSSSIVAEPISSSLPPSAADLPRESPSPSLAEKRPLEGTVTQRKEKRARAVLLFFNPSFHRGRGSQSSGFQCYISP